jgi:hypothetical protein
VAQGLTLQEDQMILRGRFTTTILATPVFAALLISTASAEKKEKVSDSGKDVTIMGCLIQGDGGYQIKTDDRTYVMTGFKDKLAKHAGHMVTVSGKVDTEREKQVAAQPGDVARFKISTWTKTGSPCP